MHVCVGVCFCVGKRVVPFLYIQVAGRKKKLFYRPDKVEGWWKWYSWVPGLCTATSSIHWQPSIKLSLLNRPVFDHLSPVGRWQWPLCWRNRRLSSGFWMDGQAISLAIATVYSGVSDCLQLCVCVCEWWQEKRRSNCKRVREYEQGPLPSAVIKNLNIKRVSYPLVVVGLFKSIVVVDGKWVWDSWILKHRRGAEWKTCNVVRESLGKLFLQRWGEKKKKDPQRPNIFELKSQTDTSLAATKASCYIPPRVKI